MSFRPNITIVVLAAGNSSRMGRAKINLPAGNKTLLQILIEEASVTSASRIIIVSGAYEPEPKGQANERFEFIKNHTWSRGIGNSIKAGLRHAMDGPSSPDAVIFLVADQPYVTAELIEQLINSFNADARLTASHYNDSPGVPALFPRRYFDEILAIQDDEGAKSILRKNIDEVTLIAFPQGDTDIDTPDDYRKFLEMLRIENRYDQR